MKSKIAAMGRYKRCYMVPMALFMPTGRRKRTEVLSQVRITTEEKEAVEWLARRLSARDGADYGVSDVVRLALARLYEEEKGHERSHPAVSAGREH
jgi:hypothetical protein